MVDASVVLAEFAHESNTFVHSTTNRADFEDRRALFGAELVQELRDTNSEIAGYLTALEAADCAIEPAMAVSATPGGVVERSTFEHFWSHLEDNLTEALPAVDGVALALHGAMVLEDDLDGDGLILERVRDIVGDDRHIVATLDLHTNITDRMLGAADALIAYEEYPHTDTFDTGRTGGELLTSLIRTDQWPVSHIERPPLLSSGPNQNTSISPMADLMAAARRAEEDEAVYKVNVTPGFFRSDIPEAGFAVSTVAQHGTAAREASRSIAEQAWAARDAFHVDYPTPTEAVETAVERVRGVEAPAAPIVLGDVGDNPGGGATGDETAMLRALLDTGVEDAGLVLIHDPAAVERCLTAGVGGEVTLDLGGKKPDSQTAPIEGLTGRVRAITDGQFRNTGPMSTGTLNDTGRTIRFECIPGPAVVITEKRIQPLDAELWRHVGVQPERLDLIVVKSANHYRADYDRIAAEVIPVDSPGGNTIDPSDYDYKRIHRPIFPLDDVPGYPPWE